jgi:hypothetical protein
VHRPVKVEHPRRSWTTLSWPFRWQRDLDPPPALERITCSCLLASRTASALQPQPRRGVNRRTITCVVEPARPRKQLLWPHATVLVLLLACGGYASGSSGAIVDAAIGPTPNGGLKGVWQDQVSPSTSTASAWRLENSWGGLPFGEPRGRGTVSWKITVHSDRDWDSWGTGGGEIRGQMIGGRAGARPPRLEQE